MTCTALLHGKPMFLLPEYQEQMLTARNVEALGAGAWVHPVTNAKKAGRMLSRVMEDEAMRAAAARFAQKHAGDASTRTVRLAELADQVALLANHPKPA